MFRNGYGMDKLNRALIAGALVLAALTIFLPMGAVRAIMIGVATAFVILALVRMFSRNFDARRSELSEYERVLAKIRAWFTKTEKRTNDNVVNLKDRRNFKYLACPQCGQRLRVPRKKGRIRVTCAKCGNRFETRS